MGGVALEVLQEVVVLKMTERYPACLSGELDATGCPGP
jgi:hypothetical protein